MKVKTTQMTLLLAAALPTLCVSNIQAAIQTYNDAGAFGAAATTELNTFSDLPEFGGVGFSKSYTTGAYSYTITAEYGDGSSDEVWGVADPIIGDPGVSTGAPGNSLVVTFTSGNVTAVGGNFFLTDFNGAFLGSDVLVELSSGESVSIPAGLQSSGFAGFISDSAVITALRATPPIGGVDGNWVTMDNLRVGAESLTPVPEASTAIAGALVLLPIGATLLRRRALKATATQA